MPPTRGIARSPTSGCSRGRLRAVRFKTEENGIMADETDKTNESGRADSLLVLLGVVGLSALTGWLNVVLLPALGVFAGLTVYAVWRRQRRMKTT